jgi:hypothetical protein
MLILMVVCCCAQAQNFKNGGSQENTGGRQAVVRLTNEKGGATATMDFTRISAAALGVRTCR